MPSKEKKGSYGGKSSFLKGKRVRKRGQISPVKNKKVGNRYQGEGGGCVTRYAFSFSNKSMPRKNYKIHPNLWGISKGLKNYDI